MPRITVAMLIVVLACVHSLPALGAKKKGGKKKELNAMEDYPGEKAEKTPKEQAKMLFMKGVTAFAAEDYGKALGFFLESYELNPKSKVLYNIGMCYRAQYSFKEAIETFRQYLLQEKKLPKKRKKEVENLIMEMESSLAQITVIVNENGARIVVDSEDVGMSPLQAILEVNPGAHDIEAVKDGFFTAKETVVVNGGDNTVVSLTMVPVMAGDGTKKPEEDTGKKKRMKKALLWGLVGAAAAAVVTTSGVLIWYYAPGPGTGPSADWTVHGP
jgi:hypothetical protein